MIVTAEENFFIISRISEDEIIALSHILLHYEIRGFVNEYKNLAEIIGSKIENTMKQ